MIKSAYSKNTDDSIINNWNIDPTLLDNTTIRNCISNKIEEFNQNEIKYDSYMKLKKQIKNKFVREAKKKKYYYNLIKNSKTELVNKLK